MALIKCPRCELNYINEEEKICSVCRREVRGEPEQFEMIELCSECGEHPVVPGTELCAYCLKEHSRRTAQDTGDEVMDHETASIGIDSVSTMDEIELDIDRDLDDDVFDDEDKEEFADDDLDEDDEEEDKED